MFTFLVALAALALAIVQTLRLHALEKRVTDLDGEVAPPSPDSPTYRLMMQLAHDVVREYQQERTP